MSSSRPKKSRHVKSKTKVMPTAFFNNEGMVHHAHIPTGQIVNGLLQVLKRLSDAIQRKRSAKYQSECLLNNELQ